MTNDLDPVALTAEMVAISSVNPDLVPGAMGESAIADFCANWLARHGLEVHRLESRPGRPSVVGIARGTGGGHSLMLNGHYDTVTLNGYDGDPLQPEVRDGRLYGRGSYDMKSGLAAAMITAATVATLGLRGDVLVACVADEEFASFGTEEVLRHFTADAGIVVEPSELQLTVAHKGFAWFDVVIGGRAAHGSRPDLGIDAIARAGHFLVALDALATELATRPPHPTLGHGSVHASIIRGGEEASSYPAECRITLERRTLPGETGEVVRQELEEILTGLETSITGFTWHIERGLERPPFETGDASAIATIVTDKASSRLGREVALRGEPFWTDCALMQSAGIDVVLFGAAGEGAHAATEWVDVESIRIVTDVLLESAIACCR